MKNFIKKYSGTLLAGTVVVAGITSAAVTPIGTLPNAVAGNVIKASDINDLVTAVGILDARTNIGDLVTADSLPTVPVYIDHADMQTAAENAADGDTFMFQGKEYKAVLSDKGTGKLWLDRNLGAYEACRSTLFWRFIPMGTRQRWSRIHNSNIFCNRTIRDHYSKRCGL